jgi:ketosteroid isomerase-like protein
MEVLPRWRWASVGFRGYLGPVSRDDVGVVREVLEEGINLDPRLESTWERASEWLAPDFEYREDPSLPGAGVHMGIPAFREAVTAYYDAMREMHLEVEECFDAGDRVLVVLRWWARGKSGVEAEMIQAGIFTVRNGKVASWQVVFDCDEAFRAVGLRR